jgi:hypothetical protein
MIRRRKRGINGLPAQLQQAHRRLAQLQLRITELENVALAKRFWPDKFGELPKPIEILRNSNESSVER